MRVGDIPSMGNVTDLEQVSDLVLLVLIAWSGLVTALYLLFYLFRPWWRNWQGQALMTKAIGNVVLIDGLALPFAIFGDYPGRWAVRLVGMSIFTAGVTFLLLALLFSPGAEHYPPRTWFRRRA